MLVDVGWTGLSQQGGEHAFGRIVSHPELALKNLKQETGEVGAREEGGRLDFSKYKVGTVVTIAPWHACAMGHQYGSIFVERDGETIAEWERCPGR